MLKMSVSENATAHFGQCKRKDLRGYLNSNCHIVVNVWCWAVKFGLCQYLDYVMNIWRKTVGFMWEMFQMLGDLPWDDPNASSLSCNSLQINDPNSN